MKEVFLARIKDSGLDKDFIGWLYYYIDNIKESSRKIHLDKDCLNALERMCVVTLIIVLSHLSA